MRIVRGTEVVAAVLLCALAITGPAHAQDRPNVVIMLGDNVGYGDIGAYGAGEVRGLPTPRIDSIAAQGLRLTQSWWSRAAPPRARH
jgi:arylsulfatase